MEFVIPHLYAVFLGVYYPPWVKLKLLFSKKYCALEIKERLVAKLKQTMAMYSQIERRGTRQGASSLVKYIN